MYKLSILTISLFFVGGVLGMESHEGIIAKNNEALSEVEQLEFKKLDHLERLGALDFAQLKKWQELRDKKLMLNKTSVRAVTARHKSSNKLAIFKLFTPFEEFKFDSDKYAFENSLSFVKQNEQNELFDSIIYCIEKISQEDPKNERPKKLALYYDFFEANGLPFSTSFLNDRRDLKEDVKTGKLSINNISFLDCEKLNKIVGCMTACKHTVIKESIEGSLFNALSSLLSLDNDYEVLNRLERISLFSTLKSNFDEAALSKKLANNYLRLKEKVEQKR